MSLEKIVVTVNGRELPGLTSIAWRAGAEHAARAADIDVPMHAFGVARPLRLIHRDDPVECYANGTRFLTGSVRDLSGDSGENGNILKISAVSTMVDFIEGAIDHPTGLTEKQDIAGIAKTFAPKLKVIVKTKAKLKVYDLHAIQPGASVYKEIERLARQEGLLLYDDGDANLIITDQPEGRHAGGLQRGINFKNSGVTLSAYNRPSETIVRGQNSRGAGKGSLTLEARAKDPEAKRDRKRIIVIDGNSTKAGVKKRAEWQMQRDIGRSTKTTPDVFGWRDAAGRLWSPNFLVHDVDPFWDIDQDMIVASAAFKQDDGGTGCKVTLYDPRAFAAPPPKGAKSGEQWKGEEPEAEVTAE
jgi:prophage tail gpP-like protein